MRLRRVDAIRYGAFRDVELGPLGDGLNLVIGSNEAGKSTFASLVRHVLFGYPRKNAVERGYHLEADEKRAGQLVFEDEAGRWVLKRTDGTKGGTPELIGPHGESDANAFIDRISAGVSADLYRQVFGFGLDELADFKSLEAIQNHLHAGVTGLESNPREALTALTARAGAIYSSPNDKREINTINRRLKEVRKQHRDLTKASCAFDDERDELVRIEERLAERQAIVDEVSQRSDTLATIAARIDDQVALRESARLDIGEFRRTRGALDNRVAAVTIDENVLQQGAAIDTVLARLEGYENRVAEVRDLDRQLEASREEERKLAVVLGPDWTGQKALNFVEEAGGETAADDFAKRAERCSIDTDTTATALARSTASLEQIEGEALDALASAGLPADAQPQDVAAARTQVDASLTGGVASPQRPLAAALLAVVGLLVAVWGFVSQDYVTAVLGGVALVVGIAIFLVKSRSLAPSASTGDAAVLVKRKGCLDVAADRMKDASRLRTTHSADKAAAAAARERSQQLDADWQGWLSEQGLQSSGGPKDARELARKVNRLAVAARQVATAQNASAAAAETTALFEESARQVGVETEDVDPVVVVSSVRALGDLLVQERERDVARKDLRAQSEAISERLARREDELGLAEETLRELLEQAGVASAEEVEGALTSARTSANDMRAELTQLADERGKLRERVESGGKSDEQARLSLEESELTERLARAVEQYAIASLAARMLEATLFEYERERQPEVIHRASQAFSTMTDGRYTRISTPMGEFDPSIFDVADRHKDNDRLSTGTAQQLYLALRLAYIESLGQRGPALPVLMDDILVNFDDDRRAHTAEILIAFARNRQVVLFTCHESTAATFAAIDSASVSRIDL